MKRVLLSLSISLPLLLAQSAVAGPHQGRPCVTGVYASPPTITAGQKTVINATTNRAASRVVLKFTDIPAEFPMAGKDHTWSVTTPVQTRAGSRPFTVTAYDSAGGCGETKSGSLLIKPAPAPAAPPRHQQAPAVKPVPVAPLPGQLPEPAERPEPETPPEPAH